ncbi:MAG: YjhX family toxin [Desulfobaccales bacterium]
MAVILLPSPRSCNRLRRKRLIESHSGSPNRISTLGRATVRPQFDNQGSLTC